MTPYRKRQIEQLKLDGRAAYLAGKSAPREIESNPHQRGWWYQGWNEARRENTPAPRYTEDEIAQARAIIAWASERDNT